MSSLTGMKSFIHYSKFSMLWDQMNENRPNFVIGHQFYITELVSILYRLAKRHGIYHKILIKGHLFNGNRYCSAACMDSAALSGPEH